MNTLTRLTSGLQDYEIKNLTKIVKPDYVK